MISTLISSVLKRLQGVPTNLRDKPHFTTWNDAATVVLAILLTLLYELRKRFEIVKKYFKNKSQVIPVNHRDLNRSQSKYNDISENPEVTKSIAILIFTLVIMIAIVPPIFYIAFFQNSPMDTWWSEFEYFLIADLLFPFSINFLYPSILYYKNDGLRKYIWQEVSGLFS